MTTLQQIAADDMLITNDVITADFELSLPPFFVSLTAESIYVFYKDT